MGTPVTVQVQPGVIEDLLNPIRLKGEHFAKTLLEKVVEAGRDSDNFVYLNDAMTYVAVALAVAGYITLEYEGDGALKLCTLTDAGRELLAS